MDQSPNLNLPYLSAAQSQKHVTLNEALRMLDALVQCAVESVLTSPPAAPADGDAYLVDASATGDWAEKDTQIAAWQDGAWAFFTPAAGWIAWNRADEELLVFDGSAWTTVVGPFDTLGISTSADATNRLALASPASLFTHAGAGHQLKINKADEASTASLLYQTAWSGRAEMGLSGNDDFSVKVSANGTDWFEAMVIESAAGANQGNVGLGSNIPGAALHIAREIPRIMLEDTNGGTDADRSWELVGSFTTATGDSKFQIKNSGAGFGSGGVALDLEKDPSSVGRAAFFGLTRSDSVLFTTANLVAAASDGIRFEFNNLSASGMSVFRAAYVDEVTPSNRTDASQKAFVADNNGDEVFLVTMGGDVGLSGLLRLTPRLTGDLPAAASSTGYLALVDDGSGNLSLRVSNGTSWVSAALS